MTYEINMTHEEFTEKMTRFSERIGIAYRCYKLLYYSTEQNLYKDSVSELWSFALILEEYLKNIKTDFMELAKSLDALE